MLKIEKEGLLLKKEQFKPSNKDFEVIGVFNPAALRLKNGKILLYVRVAERLKKWNKRGKSYSPRCVSNSRYQLTYDGFKKSQIENF